MDDRYLFRGKRTANGKWVTGSLTIGATLCYITSETKRGFKHITVDPTTVEPIAVKPKISGQGNYDEEYYVECPNCGIEVGESEHDFCGNCGQRLDWSEK